MNCALFRSRCFLAGKGMHAVPISVGHHRILLAIAFCVQAFVQPNVETNFLLGGPAGVCVVQFTQVITCLAQWCLEYQRAIRTGYYFGSNGKRRANYCLPRAETKSGYQPYAAGGCLV